jgi:hypothetical protein
MTHLVSIPGGKHALARSLGVDSLNVGVSWGFLGWGFFAVISFGTDLGCAGRRSCAARVSYGHAPPVERSQWLIYSLVIAYY